MFALPASLGIVGPKASALALGQIFTAISSGTSAYTIAIWGRSGDSISVVDNISTGGRGVTGQLAISSTGTYLAKVNNTGTSRIQVYKKTSSWAELVTGVPVITEACLGVAISPDETYLVVGVQTGVKLRIFKRSSDDFTTACTIVNQPANVVTECAFSPDGNFVFVGVASSPYITGYSRSSDTFTRLSYPASLPAGPVNGVAVNPSGDCVVAAVGSTPYLKAYYFNGTTLADLATIDVQPAGVGNTVKFSPDGAWCVVAHKTSPFMTIYAVTGAGSGTTFTKQIYFNNPPANCIGVGFDSTSTYCAVCHAASDGVTMTMYKLISGTWTKVQQTDLPSGSVGPTALIWDIDR